MEYFKVRAFVTESGAGGNAAGVVLNAEAISPSERQKIASSLGFSETAFHSVSVQGIENLEFYTPTKQIPICGHATVATFGVLSKQRPDGTYKVKMDGRDQEVKILHGKIGLKQHVASKAEVANFNNILSGAFEDFDSDKLLSVTRIDNGVSFFVIQISDWNVLKYLKPVQKVIERISAENKLIGFYLYILGQDSQFYSRMFAPYYGIDEESATGMGAGCLMAHLNWKENMKHVKIRQGLAMNPPVPSLLEAEMNSEDNEIWVYGLFRKDSEGIL